MKPSHLTTPRSLSQCHFTPGYVSGSGPSRAERIADYLIALFIGVMLALSLVVWWTA